MIKILFFSLLFSFPTFGDHHTPDDESPGTTPTAVLRVHHKNGKMLYRFAYEHNTEVAGRTDQRYSLGLRYRFFQNFKAGLYYSRRYANVMMKIGLRGRFQARKTLALTTGFG